MRKHSSVRSVPCRRSFYVCNSLPINTHASARASHRINLESPKSSRIRSRTYELQINSRGSYWLSLTPLVGWGWTWSQWSTAGSRSRIRSRGVVSTCSTPLAPEPQPTTHERSEVKARCRGRRIRREHDAEDHRHFLLAFGGGPTTDERRTRPMSASAREMMVSGRVGGVEPSPGAAAVTIRIQERG